MGESLLQSQSEGVLPGQRGSGRVTAPESQSEGVLPG